VAPRKRKQPALVPGYARIPGPLRRYRVVATGEEISRRQYQQRARGYVYERLAKGRARAKARRAWLDEWIAKVRARFSEFADVSKTAILRELRRLGMTPPHHGRRKPSPAEAAKELAFTDFMGYARPAAAQLYPTLEGGAETLESATVPRGALSAALPNSQGTTPSLGRSAAPTRR
jgi:hypothetical protein